MPAGGFSFRGVAAILEAPLVLSPATPGDSRVDGAVVSRRVGFHLAGAFAPARWVTVHAGLPVNYGTSTGRYGNADRDDLARTTAGDLRLGTGVSFFSLLGLERPFGLELALDTTVWLPTGDPASLTGEGAVRAQPTLSASAVVGPLAAAATAGWHVRPETTAYNVRRDDELRVAGLLSAGLPFLGARLAAAVHGAVPTADAPRPFDPQTGARGTPSSSTAVIEAVLGLEVRSDDGFIAEFGGGRGLTDAAGSPAARAWLSLGYATPATPAPRGSTGPDADADGVPDGEDDCPFEAEDADGERDADGCPEGPPAVLLGAPSGAGGSAAPLAPLPPLQRIADTDADGIEDALDVCPSVPEDLDGFVDQDGCPEPDDDGDGVPDPQDACPGVAETANGVLDADGCPDIGPDADGDGVEDRLDACPGLPETVNGLRDDDGCPEDAGPEGPPLAPLPPLPLGTNLDADGLPDADDLCPAAAEDLDGFADGDGCPEPDDDGDGVPDVRDACPRVAGAPGSPDGCATLGPDADADGVADAFDGCPALPETPDGIRDADGCPETAPAADAPGIVALWPLSVAGDADGDGLFGVDDDCPGVAEDADGYADGDGCPEADDDQDGLADAVDACPRVAEVKNAWLDGDGCPDTVPAGAEGLVGTVNALAIPAGGERLGPTAGPVLDRVAAMLRTHPEVTLRVDAYAEAGDPGSASARSTHRAAAVREALIARGISPVRLTVRGLGPAGPPRVELHFLATPRKTTP